MSWAPNLRSLQRYAGMELEFITEEYSALCRRVTNSNPYFSPEPHLVNLISPN